MARKIVTLGTLAMGCVGDAYFSQNCSVQREEREKSTFIRMTWQNRGNKEQLFQRPQKTGLSNNLRVYETERDISTTPSKCGASKEKCDKKCDKKCGTKPEEPK